MMDNIRAFELKVGIFILIGIAILFLIVFSIGDINLSRTGYRIRVLFNFANGMGGTAPVRLAGVGVGQAQGIKVIYDEKEKMTKAELTVWINDSAKIERDAKFTINTLGLLGEKYLEIYPGTPGIGFLKAGDTVIGKDPVPMEKITENISRLSDSVTVIVERLKNGEGTIGKLLKEDAIYDDFKAIAGNFKEFSEDIKSHPWKLLFRPRGA
ncbi:MAG: MlaD family protein [Candidatus Omnitrophota bacterium]|nr:MlaD family protein [Candidatus Omnitrophota bacterium]